jgi:hypothetical protein
MRQQKLRTFAVGDRVTWRSQANGSWLVKVGTVIHVVPPYRLNPHRGWRLATPRNVESYVVEVAGKPTTRGPGKSTLYWPLTGKLRRFGRRAA